MEPDGSDRSLGHCTPIVDDDELLDWPAHALELIAGPVAGYIARNGAHLGLDWRSWAESLLREPQVTGSDEARFASTVTTIIKPEYPEA